MTGEAAEGENSRIKYVVDRLVGHGSFGMVYLVKSAETGESFALKRILYDNSFKSREVQIVRAVQHKNIVGLRHSFYSDDAPTQEEKRAGETPRLFLNLVFDYYPDNLQRFIRHFTQQREILPVLFVRLIIYQVAHALARLHSPAVRVMHRDLKPANVLLNPMTMRVVLCDFGHAKPIATPSPSSTYIASRHYRAPELVLGDSSYTEAVDLWALGCLLGEMLAGVPLLPGDSSVGQLVEIVRLLGTPSAAELAAISPSSPTAPLPILTRTPLSDLLSPSTERSALDLLEQLLVYDPSKRLKAVDVLAHPFFDPLFGQPCLLPNGVAFPHDVFEVAPVDLEACSAATATKLRNRR